VKFTPLCEMALSKPRCPYMGDGRTNYTGWQWSSLYMSADDDRYLLGFSYVGFTVIGSGCYVLCTRMSSRTKNSTKQQFVKEFLCQIRRPLCRWLVYVGEKEECEKDKSLSGLSYVKADIAFSGAVELWGELPCIDGVRIIPPVQIGVPAKFVTELKVAFNSLLTAE